MYVAAAVLAHLPADGRPITARELQAVMGWPERRCRDALARLAREGRIRRIYRGAYTQQNAATATTAGPCNRATEAAAVLQSAPQAMWTPAKLADIAGMAPPRAAAILAGLAHDGVVRRGEDGYEVVAAAEPPGPDGWNGNGRHPG
jgi:DNA-binding IclR family transcriptional regulator